MVHPRWVAGLYYDGVVGESKLQEVLELHKRDTVCLEPSLAVEWQKKRAHQEHWQRVIHYTSPLWSKRIKENNDSINKSTLEKPTVSANI